MYSRLSLLAAVLICAGESSVHGLPEKVLASAGGVAILPCNFSIAPNGDLPTVEWSKEGLKPEIVFLYRGCEDHVMKNTAFEYRTSLIMRELKNGNISLRISDVQLEDAGKYHCMWIWMNGLKHKTEVELVVVAVSAPKLSFTPAEGGGVTVQCEATCWSPEPEITFLDDNGKNIHAEDPKATSSRGCHTVIRRATLQDAPSRVTCRVQQLDINEVRETELLLPVEGPKSCFLTALYAVGVTIVLSGCGAVFLWKRLRKPGHRDSPANRQDENKTSLRGVRDLWDAEYIEQSFPLSRVSSGESTTSGGSEKNSLMESVRVDNLLNVSIDQDKETIHQLQVDKSQLQAEVADLKSKLHGSLNHQQPGISLLPETVARRRSKHRSRYLTIPLSPSSNNRFAPLAVSTEE